MVNQLNFLEETILFRIVTWFPLFLSISRFSINLVKKLNPPLFIKRIFTHLISISGIKKKSSINGDVLVSEVNVCWAFSIKMFCLSSKLSIFKPNAHLAMISIVVALSCLKENTF